MLEHRLLLEANMPTQPVKSPTKRKEGIAISEKELKQMEKEITSELKPFLDSIKTMDRNSRNFRIFEQTLHAYSIEMNRVQQVIDFMMQGVDTANIMSGTFFYFGIVESFGNILANFMVMLLVANGKDFHIERQYGTPRIKHAVSFEDLEKERVPLTSKLSFLRENGISRLASIIDSKLRNDIAHMKFDVKEDKLYIRGKPADEIVNISATKLRQAINTITFLFNQLSKEI